MCGCGLQDLLDVINHFSNSLEWSLGLELESEFVLYGEAHQHHGQGIDPKVRGELAVH